jgi:hypothetical protein
MNTCPPGTLCLTNTQILFISACLIGLGVYLFQSRSHTKTIVYNVPQTTKTDTYRIEDTERAYRRIADPLEVPEQTYPFRESTYNRVNEYEPKMAINIPTRGAETQFQAIGVLTSINNTNRVLQLFGRAIYPGSNKWQYYTTTDNFQSVKVGVEYKSRNCLSDLGCDQLYSGDTILIPAYPGDNFRVEIYNYDKPKYISYLV